MIGAASFNRWRGTMGELTLVGPATSQQRAVVAASAKKVC